MLVEVEITTTVTTAQYGSLGTGTILRCPAEFAAHLVNDCSAAKYVLAEKKEAEVVGKKVKTK